MVVQKYTNGDRYEGDWERDMKHGEGTLYYKDGGKYRGNWANNCREGYGVNTWANGIRYEGHWAGSKQHGKGKLTYADGGVYEGEWEDNQRHGEGVNQWANGERYEGSWENNVKSGEGKYTYPNGGSYEGEWEDDMRNGEGVNTWPNGNQYEGTWADNAQQGQGTYTYTSGGNYVGEWAENMRNGHGVNTWPNGDRYEGLWRYNQKHGQGTFTRADGTKQSGVWANDELESQGPGKIRKNNDTAAATGDRSQNTKNAVQFKGFWSNGHPFLVTLMQKSDLCPYHALAREFVISLNWAKDFFDNKQDRCYCNHCYKDAWHDVIDAGEGKYVIPRGWVRLGLQIDPVTMKTQDIWNKWIVTFHGTSKVAAQSIIAHRQFCLPGDVLIDGTKLAIRPGHIPGQMSIYTSPTIAYSSGPAYSPLYNFHSNENNANYEAQIVLQCRQMPSTFQIGPETIGAGKTQICQHIPNSQIEYFTDRRSSLLAYGLLVRFRPRTA